MARGGVPGTGAGGTSQRCTSVLRPQQAVQRPCHTRSSCRASCSPLEATRALAMSRTERYCTGRARSGGSEGWRGGGWGLQRQTRPAHFHWPRAQPGPDCKLQAAPLIPSGRVPHAGALSSRPHAGSAMPAERWGLVTCWLQLRADKKDNQCRIDADEPAEACAQGGAGAAPPGLRRPDPMMRTPAMLEPFCHRAGCDAPRLWTWGAPQDCNM